MVVNIADLKPCKLSESIYSSEPPVDLIDSIKRNGLIVPIWITRDNIIISGHRRVNACKHLGMTKITAETRLYSDSLVIESNRYREKTWSEKLKEAEALERILKPKAEAREKSGKRIDPTQNSAQGETRQHIARAINVSHDTLYKAKIIAQQKPALLAKVDAGNMSIHSAYQQIIQQKKSKQRLQILQQQRQTSKTQAIIYNNNALDFLATINDHSVDLLLTDPPYMTEVKNIKSFVNEWLVHALRKLKSTGRAYICIGPYPEELHCYLNAVLQLDWHCQILVWTYKNCIGPTPKLSYKNNCQVILYLYSDNSLNLNSPNLIEQFSVHEINAPDGRQYERYNVFQKPDELAERFIRHSTKEGDTVIDPFAGTGTFLLTAADLGRKAKGCDNNQNMLRIAEKRGAQIVF